MPQLLWATIFLIGCTMLATSQEPATPVEVPPAELQSFLINRIAPVYPPLARQARIQGTVFLKVVVNKAGGVRDVQVVSGHPMLVPSAVEAVKRWRYTPYEKDGEPVEVRATIEIKFELAGNPAADNPTAGRAENVHPDNSGASAQPGGIVGAVDAATTSLQAPPQRVRVSSGVAAGLLVIKIPPRYPIDARQQGVQGMVVLKVNIDKEGNIYKTELISGHQLLAPAAIEAVQQWKYKPYLLNGIPVEVETQVQVNFVLKQSPPST